MINNVGLRFGFRVGEHKRPETRQQLHARLRGQPSPGRAARPGAPTCRRARPARRPPSSRLPAFPRSPPGSGEAAAGSLSRAGLREGVGSRRRATAMLANERGRAAGPSQWALPARSAFFEALAFPRNHFGQRRRRLKVRVSSGVLAGGPRDGAGRGCPPEFPKCHRSVRPPRSRSGRMVGVRRQRRCLAVRTQVEVRWGRSGAVGWMVGVTWQRSGPRWKSDRDGGAQRSILQTVSGPCGVTTSAHPGRYLIEWG